MFNWFSSDKNKVANSKAASKQSNYLNYIPGGSLLTTAATNLKNKSVAMLSSSATSLKKAHNQLPQIGISGYGFTVNGYVFDLGNVPKNLQSNLKLLLSLCFILKTKAEDFYFRDPAENTNYKLEVMALGSVPSPACDPVEIGNEIMQACNATAIAMPYPTNFDEIYSYSDCVRSVIGNSIFKTFYRETNSSIQTLFENCIKEAIGTPDPTTPDETVYMAIGITGAAIVLCCIGCNYRYFYNKCRALDPVAKELRPEEIANVPHLSL